MSTIIIVDRIGEKSRIVDMAKAIDGEIVQMSMAYWVKDVCRILKERIHYRHELLNIPDMQIKSYVEEHVLPMKFEMFL